MATKPQAKTAIDSAATQIKADIDTILPVGVNIRDGEISFGPIRYAVLLDAGNSLATAESWETSIKANLTAASRTFIVRGVRGRRGGDPPFPNTRDIVIVETNGPATFRITNF